MENFLKNEITGWKKSEIFWLILACSIITGLSIYWKDSILGIISATTGVACVVCTGKGKLSAYIFGLVNCITYAIIAYNATLYGETMLNTLYYIPMQFVGFFVWKNNMNEETQEVIKKKMKTFSKLILIVGIGIGTYLYGLILGNMGDAMPFLDAFTTVASVVAMIISIKMFAEQWVIWVIINIASVCMWYCNFIDGNDNLATLLMWCVFLINSIISLIKWEREANQNAV